MSRLLRAEVAIARIFSALPRAIALAAIALALPAAPVRAEPDCYMVMPDGREVNLIRRLCRQRLDRQTLDAAGAEGELYFAELELVPGPDPTVAALRGRVSNRANGPVAVRSLRVDLRYGGETVQTLSAPLPVDVLGAGETVRFEHQFQRSGSADLPLDRLQVFVASYRALVDAPASVPVGLPSQPALPQPAPNLPPPVPAETTPRDREVPDPTDFPAEPEGPSPLDALGDRDWLGPESEWP